jgi:hypothetical protein
MSHQLSVIRYQETAALAEAVEADRLGRLPTKAMNGHVAREDQMAA